MLERERKFQIIDGSTGADVVARFLRAGFKQVGAQVQQQDVVLARDRSDLLSPRSGTVVARIRRVESFPDVITLKRRREADLDREEWETSVEDGNAMMEILSALGLTKIVTVSKKRTSFRVGVSTTILVDEVETLGSFVEIEVLSADEDSADSSSELERLASSVIATIGETAVAEVSKGYDRLLIELTT